MLTKEQTEMFARLANTRPFTEWLQSELDRNTQVLTQMRDEAQLRMAQGRAQVLTEIRGYLEESGAKRPQ